MGKKSDLESVHLVNHSKCMLAAFQNFRQDSTMLDVTLACNGQSIKAHKLLLSACSPFFKELFAENPCAHPIIILRDFEFTDLKAVIDFVYKGELSVPRERLMSALKVAEELHIRGLRRSEPSTKKYETLYNQVCGKLSSKKKRKRRRHNSSDSDVKEYLSINDSDNIESDTSVKGELVSQTMDFEEHSVNDQDSRPFVLRVGDQSLSNEENSKDKMQEGESLIVEIKEAGSSNTDLSKTDLNRAETEALGTVSETTSSSSLLDTFVSGSENSNNFQESIPVEEQSSSHEDLMEASSTQKLLSVETLCDISSVCSPESVGSENQVVHDEGKRFVCSKCDSVFTSRINFMRHKMEGHKSAGNSNSYKCQHCSFSAIDQESLKNHELTHTSKVPFKCSICSEEFASEILYEKHLAVHEENTIPVHDLSPKFGHGFFSSHSKVQEKLVLFRCSVCFTKFTSKLSCQLHEKSCQGK